MATTLPHVPAAELSNETADRESPAPVRDRRRAKSVPSPARNRPSLPGRLVAYWGRFHWDDIVSARHHSQDFIDTRAEYISLRLRFMVVFFAITVPLWIPIDFLTLRPEHATSIAVGRGLLAAVLIAVALATLRTRSSRQVHALLAVSMIAPSVFYVAAMLILRQGVAEQPLAGYSFMPYVMVAILGLFPLTVLAGIVLEGTILAFQVGLSAEMGRLLTLDTFNEVWVFVMLGGATLWNQSGQLLMLLKLYRESTQDPLTGLINRRVLMKRLATEVGRSDTEQEPFCILMFDLDRFKRINDNYGHLTGDQVLKATARILRDGLRQQDIVARFGGEEFVAVLPDVDAHEAIQVAERIRKACYATKVAAPNGEPIQLSTSVGVTQYEPGEAIEASLSRVDECLYQAKEQGRNRVVHAQSVPD